MKKTLFLAGLLVFIIGIAFAETGVKKRRPLPFEYGRVVINNYSEAADFSPVVFDHWLHRAKFTCRLCHVDIGFAMEANETGIRADDNNNGYYCGSCHNGKAAFSSCRNDFVEKDFATCIRCHSEGRRVEKKYDFREFVKGWPRERLGNGVDWEGAEQQGKINPVDYIEGISIKRDKFVDPPDFELKSKVLGMPDIIFSHRKHTVWNGCEVCHPEIFVGIKKGMTKYSMVELYEGKYCGVCHNNVAFPLLDCQRCHTEKTQ
jgi:c(7)-type cytochrome triheme protein